MITNLTDQACHVVSIPVTCGQMGGTRNEKLINSRTDDCNGEDFQLTRG